MAIDLEAIRRRVAELSGVRKTSSVQLWKPTLGEHKIRCLPWKNAPVGQPFMERWFYYIGKNSGILTPKQFGKPDPIDDLMHKLFKSGKPEDRFLAKKLMPKMRAYAPVIVRGEEDKGVLVWSFGKLVYQRLLGFFIDEDYGDIQDPNEGFDLKVTISHIQGKEYNDTVVDCKGRTSKLCDDAAKSAAWLESVPNIDDMYRMKSPQEIENILNGWLNGGDAGSTEAGNETTRGRPASEDALDTLVKEVKGESKPVVKEDAPKAEAKPLAKKAVKKASVDVDDDSSTKKQSIDEAFEDLMKDE